MRYALLMSADPAHTEAMSQAEIDEVMRKHTALGEEIQPSGELVGGAGLAPPEETTLVRYTGEGNAPVTTQGPLAADATEHLTAYYEVECSGLDRARAIAERLLDHHVTSVEIRRIHDAVDGPRAS